MIAPPPYAIVTNRDQVFVILTNIEDDEIEGAASVREKDLKSSNGKTEIVLDTSEEEEKKRAEFTYPDIKLPISRARTEEQPVTSRGRSESTLRDISATLSAFTS